MAATSTVPPTVLLHGVSWKTYVAMSDDDGFAHLRMTYDRGTLEIMAPMTRHELPPDLISDFLKIVADELDIPLAALGSTTVRRKRVERGLEPDRGFFVGANAVAWMGEDDLDLSRSPPPDLAVESDVANNSVPKPPLYAAIGVPEVWRWERGRLTVYILQPSGEYATALASRAFPELPLADFARFVARGHATLLIPLLREFRRWVRDTLVPPG